MGLPVGPADVLRPRVLVEAILHLNQPKGTSTALGRRPHFREQGCRAFKDKLTILTLHTMYFLDCNMLFFFNLSTNMQLKRNF